MTFQALLGPYGALARVRSVYYNGSTEPAVTYGYAANGALGSLTDHENNRRYVYSLDSVDTNNSYHPFHIIQHEMRHAYQYAAIRGLDVYGFNSPYHESREALLSWYMNIYHYRSSKEYGLEAYLAQPIEVDAREFEWYY